MNLDTPSSGLAYWTKHGLLPRDFTRLGTVPNSDTFRHDLLVRHCALIPTASEDALQAAISSGRTLMCHSLTGCENTYVELPISKDWSICPLCVLGILCPHCPPDKSKPCRACLKNATVSLLPTAWKKPYNIVLAQTLSGNGLNLNEFDNRGASAVLPRVLETLFDPM